MADNVRADNRTPKSPIASSRGTEPGHIDPWNWKMPSRADLMNLNTLSEDKDQVRVRLQHGVRTKRNTSTNMVANDIHGAKPRVEIPREVTRQLFYDNKDIAGAQPRALHVELKRDFNALINEDIKGAKPQYLKFQTNRKVTNPLNPEYELPQYQITYPDPPKFIRNAMDVQDIEGAKCKPRPYKFLGDKIKTDDIQGTSPKKRMERKFYHDQKYQDVYQKKEQKREVPFNPLFPTYKIRDDNGELVEIGAIKGSWAAEPYYRKNPEHNTQGTVKGIEFATTGTKGLGNFKHRERRQGQVRETNNISDISGTQAKSLVRGIRLPPDAQRRVTNPLDPTYQMPGTSDHKQHQMNLQIDPYGLQGCSMTKDLYINVQNDQRQRPQTSKYQSNRDKASEMLAPSKRNVEVNNVDIDHPIVLSARSKMSQPVAQSEKKSSKKSELIRPQTAQIPLRSNQGGSDMAASQKAPSQKSRLIEQDPVVKSQTQMSKRSSKPQSGKPQSSKQLSKAQKLDKFIYQPY